MATLSDEQIELAVEAASNASIPGLGWNASTGEKGLELWRASLRAAAPFLQLPWPEPTEEESEEFRSLGIADFRGALEEFVRSRNAALLPKPVDPRKLAIVAGIKSYGYVGDKDALADHILAALDEVR